jgi:transcriptional regulator with XRE-family HTH domain
MPKTIHRTEHEIFLSILKRHRKEAGLTQVQCSKELGRPQSFMSDVESGSRRLDIVQIRDLCRVIGITLIDLIGEFEKRLSEESHLKP